MSRLVIKKSLAALSTGYADPATRYLVPGLKMFPKIRETVYYLPNSASTLASATFKRASMLSKAGSAGVETASTTC